MMEYLKFKMRSKNLKRWLSAQNVNKYLDLLIDITAACYPTKSHFTTRGELQMLVIDNDIIS